MADEPAAAPQVEDTPVVPEAPAAPDTPTQPESPEVTDYKQRYEDLRPEFDRRNELLADIEGRNGPERQAQALSQHARIELEDEEAQEADDEFDLPPDPSEEIAAIKQELAERDEQAQAAEFDQLEVQYTEATVNALEDKEGIKLSDEAYDLVVNYGLAHRDPHDGKPDFEGGMKALKADREAARKEYAESKRSAALAPVGTEGEAKVNLRDPDARRKVAVEAYEAEQGREE